MGVSPVSGQIMEPSEIQDSTETVYADGQIQEDNTQDDPLLSRYAERILTRFDKSALFVTILYVVILYSIVTLITLLIIILLNRGRMQREQKMREYLKEEYQLKLMDYLFEEEKLDQAFMDLERIASNRFNRQILIDQMIDLSINLKGEIKEVIRELYLKLGLKEDSLTKAYSRKWHENVKGFRELAFLARLLQKRNGPVFHRLNGHAAILGRAKCVLIPRQNHSYYS